MARWAATDPILAAGFRPVATAQLLAVDPELGSWLGREERQRADAEAWARVLELLPGPLELPSEPAPFAGWFGLLVLDGLLVRRVRIGGATWPELLGQGDLIRPWSNAGAIASIPSSARFEVVSPARLALLDRDVAARVAPWPQLAAALIERATARAHWLAAQLAAGQPALIDERIWMVLWHLADRWGVVSGEGVELRMPALTHRVLAEMLGARRPTVSLAVRRLARRGLLTHRSRFGWTLHGAPERYPSGTR